MDPAGTGNWHVRSPPDERALKSTSLRGLDISTQRTRQITRDNCENFYYILTMDENNYRTVASLCRESPEREVPDPSYGSPDGFERVLNLVEEASEGLLQDICERRLNRRG